MELAERLLELAFEYKKSKLWKVMKESELFSIRFADGEMGYISILGMQGDHCAMILYIGDTGYTCLYRLQNTDFQNLTEFEMRELAMQNDCIHCAMESKDRLFEDELEMTRAFAKAHGIHIGGKNAYPHMIRYTPDCIPWKVVSEKDQDYLAAALEAALEVSSILTDPARAEDKERFRALLSDGDVLPCFEKEGDVFRLEETAMPMPVDPVYPEPEIANELLIARLKKKKKSGRLLLDVMRFMEPVQEEEDEAPFFPYLVFALNPTSGKLLATAKSLQPESGAQELLEDMAQALINQNFCPKSIHVMNERSYKFVEQFCHRLKINLVRSESLPELESAEDDFINSFRETEEDDFQYLIDYLENLSDEEILAMPDEVKFQIMGMVLNEMFPEELSARLHEVMKF